ncbi:MAG: M3 family oligoendopeptidase [Anaerolineaceae bacterium]
MNANNYPYTQSAWSLTDLIASGSETELKSILDQLNEKVTSFEKERDNLKPEIRPAEFSRLLEVYEEIARLESRLGSYASLRFAENTQDQAAQSLVMRVQQMGAEFSNRLLFFSLWWKELEDEAANRLMVRAGDRRYWLEEMRHFKKFTLTEPEEKIINLKDVTGASALGLLYDSITNRYSFKLTIDGLEKELTRGEISAYVRDPDPGVRASAYKELNRVFSGDGPILGQIYQTLVRDWRNENISLRGFVSPISVRNLANDLPDDVVDMILESCRKNAGIFHRFFRLKARWLGVEKLHRYDIYAPTSRSKKKYSFEESVALVMASFDGFDPKVKELALRVFESRHVDSEVRVGKQSGAFCLTALPDLTPWVMLNYQGRPSDVATMAHELGHAVHSMLASDHSIFTTQACLPLAETASTFGEMVLINRLLQEEPDQAVRRELLFRQLDDAFATILRQSFFALFEREAHEMVEKGASVDEISAAYFRNLEAEFGDSVELTEDFRWEWVSIPHIYHVPFYVYAYSFGQLLVFSLYSQYVKEGEPFKNRYFRLLAAGGSKSPADILREAGIDLYSAAFWQAGFNEIEKLVARLEALPVTK